MTLAGDSLCVNAIGYSIFLNTKDNQCVFRPAINSYSYQSKFWTFDLMILDGWNSSEIRRAVDQFSRLQIADCMIVTAPKNLLEIYRVSNYVFEFTPKTVTNYGRHHDYYHYWHGQCVKNRNGRYLPDDGFRICIQENKVSGTCQLNQTPLNK